MYDLPNAVMVWTEWFARARNERVNFVEIVYLEGYRRVTKC
jgi:hypothetical protein